MQISVILIKDLSIPDSVYLEGPRTNLIQILREDYIFKLSKTVIYCIEILYLVCQKILCLYKRKIEFFPHTVTSHNVDLLLHASLRSVPRGGYAWVKCTDFFYFHGQWGGISSRKLEERSESKVKVFNLGPLFPVLLILFYEVGPSYSGNSSQRYLS